MAQFVEGFISLFNKTVGSSTTMSTKDWSRSHLEGDEKNPAGCILSINLPFTGHPFGVGVKISHLHPFTIHRVWQQLEMKV